MKKISFILILLTLGFFSSCSNDSDDGSMEIPDVAQNGFEFDSEFFTTDELFVTFQPGQATFFIIDDTSEFNCNTRAFEGDPGQVIVISVLLEFFEDLIDIEGVFSNAIDSEDDEITIGSFTAALVRGVSNVAPLLVGAPPEEGDTIETFIASEGEVTISLSAQSTEFILAYRLTTSGGVITGTHEGEFMQAQ